MKKIILLVLALALTLSFVACGKNETPDEPDKDNEQNTTDNTDNTDKTEDKTDNTDNTDNTEDKTEAKTWGDATCEEIINTMVSQLDIQIMMPMCMPIAPDTNPLQGLAPDGETGEGGIDFADGAVYMPMVSAQRFDMAVFRVKEGADVNAFVEDLKTRNASQQWICATPPDFVKVVALGDVVLYLSIDKSLTDGDAIVKAFENPIEIVAPSTGDEIIEDETVEGDETVDGENTDGEAELA